MAGAGSVVAERFVLDHSVGAGGMGEVFRARDTAGDALVAVKLLRRANPESMRRFFLEARILSSLRHPGIVEYLAHGQTDDGDAYLVMEWLEGEDLARRTRYKPPATPEALAVVIQVAQALNVAHRRGIIHRDIKPQNLFVVGGDLKRIKILDFGVARLSEDAPQLTATGVLMGTPAYMSPEQARGAREVDARADVYALGCLLYQLITGRTPFQSPQIAPLLAKIILEDAPRLRLLHADLPAALDELCARMLAKSPDDRPADALEVAAELAAIADGVAAAPASRREPALTTAERRLLCLILFKPPRGAPPPADQATLPVGGLPLEIETLRAFVARHGGTLMPLVDGSFVGTLWGSEGQGEHALRAAECAVAIGQLVGAVPIALAMGFSEDTRFSVGEVIEQAARLLDDGEPGIRVDSAMAALLELRFEVTRRGDRFFLHAERGGVRRLLGRPTPYVGRDRELANLEALYGECVTDGSARAALVSAAPGMGKSRLRHELCARLARRADAPALLVGHGEPLRAEVPYALLADALRRSFGMLRGEPAAERHAKLRARVADPRVAFFLGELVGEHLADERLQGARQHPGLMAQEVLRALVDFLRAESERQPLLVILEDVHWGDAASIKLLAAALAVLPRQPLLVLALARPEGREPFRAAWSPVLLEEIWLAGLPARAAERLVRQILAEQATPSVVDKIAGLANGNAFYLEELIRAVSEGLGEQLPPSVLAMASARLEHLPADARRVLRAASVFGDAAWREGIEALLADALPARTIGEALDLLAREEVLVRRGQGRFSGCEEHAFRHGLLREAAYATLTSDDRALGHRLAAAWLAKLGEEPKTLAEHHTAAGEWWRAADCLLQATRTATAMCALPDALTLARRGLALLERAPADGERVSLELQLTLAAANVSSARHGMGSPEVEREYQRAQALCRGLEDRSARVHSMLGLASFYATRGELRVAATLAEEAHGLADPDADTPDWMTSAGTLGIFTLHRGEYARAADLLTAAMARWDRQLHERYTRNDPTDPAICFTYLALAFWYLGENERALELARANLERLRALDHPYTLFFGLYFTAELLQLDRRPAEVAPLTAESLALQQRHGFMWPGAQPFHGWVLAHAGHVAEGVAMLQLDIDQSRAAGAKYMLPHKLGMLVELQLAAGAGRAELTKLLDEADATAEHGGDRSYVAELLRLRGEVTGDAAWLERARTEARAQAAPGLELRAAAALARLRGDAA